VRLAARPEVAPQHPADDELRQVPRVTAAIVARIQGGVLMMMFTGLEVPDALNHAAPIRFGATAVFS
jgi:hypothetical protein